MCVRQPTHSHYIRAVSAYSCDLAEAHTRHESQKTSLTPNTHTCGYPYDVLRNKLSPSFSFQIHAHQNLNGIPKTKIHRQKHCSVRSFFWALLGGRKIENDYHSDMTIYKLDKRRGGKKTQKNCLWASRLNNGLSLIPRFFGKYLRKKISVSFIIAR